MVAKNPNTSGFTFTDDHLKKIAKYPHLLGHMLGKTKLTKMHSKWACDAWKSKENYSIQAHRGSYKTTILTEIGTIWWLLFHPNERLAIVRKTATDAQDTLLTIRRAFEREEIKALFEYAHGIVPVMTVKKGDTLTFNFKTSLSKEGSVSAFGVDGSITGKHFDKIICDDIITLKDRISKAERERTKEFMRELYTNIIDPDKPIIHVGTPWHKEDGWELTPADAAYDCYTTGLLSDRQINDKRKTTTSILFCANYELRHDSPDDLIFASVAYEEPWLQGVSRVYAHLDCAFSGNHWSALTFMAKLKDGRIQAKGWAFKENVKTKINWIQKLCKQFRVKKLYLETNPDKGYTADALEDGDDAIVCGRYPESMNKHIKIVTHLEGQWSNIVWDIDCNDDYLSQILDYREGQEPDDAPDSAASLIRAEFPVAKKKSSALNEW